MAGEKFGAFPRCAGVALELPFSHGFVSNYEKLEIF